MDTRHRRAGMTLVELLVVLAVIGVLVALLLPAVQGAREAARRTRCMSNLKQVGIALHGYHDVHGRLPGRPGTSWAVGILPHLEHGALFDAFNSSLTARDAGNHTVAATRIAAFTCPSERPVALSDGMVVGNACMNAGAAGLPLAAFRDGTSRTVAASDIPSAWFGAWVEGPQSSVDAIGGGGHAGRRLLLFADGSVRCFSQDLSPAALHALGSPDGGEILESP